MSDDEILTPQQAAVYCAVHGFELWLDTKDTIVPYAVMREDWRYWNWTGDKTLTPRRLQVAMRHALADDMHSDDKFRHESNYIVRRRVQAGAYRRIDIEEMPHVGVEFTDDRNDGNSAD